MTFAEWFRHQLKRREWTQTDFQRQSGLGSSTVSLWATGKRLPDPASCDIIAAAFLVPLDDVLAAAGHRPADRSRSDNETAAAIAAMVRRVNWTADRVAGIEAILRQWAEVDRRDRE